MTIVRFILGLTACCIAGQSHAQWTSDAWMFTDPTREDRPIPVNFLRPDGDPEPLPWVIVAHGFVMGPDDYDDLATALVDQGFLVGLVDTETGFATSHCEGGISSMPPSNANPSGSRNDSATRPNMLSVE